MEFLEAADVILVSYTDQVFAIDEITFITAQHLFNFYWTPVSPIINLWSGYERWTNSGVGKL